MAGVEEMEEFALGERAYVFCGVDAGRILWTNIVVEEVVVEVAEDGSGSVDAVGSWVAEVLELRRSEETSVSFRQVVTTTALI